MPIHHSLWTVSQTPSEISASSLEAEQMLEDMIVAQPRILSDEWMLIGRQENTGYGGIIDLLAIAPDGGLVLVELKRNKTPREVVAQALDYATWVENLEAEDIAAIYQRFKPDQNLHKDFQNRFGQALDEDTLNNSHQIVVVAAKLDSSTERIVGYLSDRDIAINVLYFQVFAHGDQQLLSRAWLQDPGEVQISATTSATREKEPWNGEFYASFGDVFSREWADAVKYGFISAGGGAWYSRTLDLLEIGDRIWVKSPDHGFVGVGRVKGKRIPASDFIINNKPALEVLQAAYHREVVNDPERCEYFVPVEWLDTVDVDQAVQEVGMFGNQNTVCKPKTPKWRTTVERLKQVFTKYDD